MGFRFNDIVQVHTAGVTESSLDALTELEIRWPLYVVGSVLLSHSAFHFKHLNMDENSAATEKPNVETVSNEDKESPIENVKLKKTRRRKKALHTAIRNQMEFYFSDANLSKDRFMQNAIKEGSGEDPNP